MLLSSLIISNCEDRVLSMLTHLTRVLYLLCSSSFHLIKSCISFQSECYPNYIILIPSPSRFNRSARMYFLAIATLFLMPFNLQGSSNVPCSSFLTECFQLCSSMLYSFFQYVQPLKVRGFTCLSKKQLSLPLLFLFCFSPVPS